MQLAVGAGSVDGARVEHLVPGLEQCCVGSDGLDYARGVEAEDPRASPSGGVALALIFTSAGLTEIDFTATRSRGGPVRRNTVPKPTSCTGTPNALCLALGEQGAPQVNGGGRGTGFEPSPLGPT